MTTLLDLLFIAASAAVLIHGINHQMNIGVATYLGSYLVFVLVTHTVWRIGANAGYGIDYYLITHSISFIFLVIVVAPSKRDIKQNALLLRSVRTIKPSVLFAAFSIWLAFQGYLLAKYGTSGALSLDGPAGEGAKAYLDSSALMLVNTFVGGAALAMVLRLGVDPGFSRNLVAMPIFAAFLMYSLAFGATLAGGRRTILLLAICFLVTRIIATREKVGAALKRHLPAVLIVSVACLTLAWYYQHIRNNVYLPLVQSALSDAPLSRKLEGLTLLLTPGLADAYSPTNRFASTVNRSGPFDLLFSIVEARSEFSRSSDGELTVFCIEKVIPKIFYPDKPEYDVDYLIGTKFGVVMGRNFAVNAEFFQSPDYSTTVLAILFGDFGWIAVPIAAFIAVVAIRLSVYVLGLAPASTLVTLGALGVMFELTGTIEGSLITVLSSLRTLLMVAGLGLLLRLLSLGRSPIVRRREA